LSQKPSIAFKIIVEIVWQDYLEFIHQFPFVTTGITITF